MKITLKDGSVKEYENNMSVIDIAKDISEGLARVACVGEVDGEVVDLRTVIDKDCELNILTFDSDEGKHAFRHTASHILAQAVKRLYPETKLAIGPSIDNGFYYDMEKDTPFTQEDLEKIEKEMKKIVKENLEITSFTKPRDEAIAFMKERNEPYKVELIEDLPEDSVISFYQHGEFVDLCAGPHVASTGKVKAFKLQSIAGAYWRGDEKNPQLQRIYGTSFPTQEELDAARKGWLQSQEVSRAQDGKLVYDLTNNMRLNRTMEWSQKLEDKISSLSVADINKIMAEYIKKLEPGGQVSTEPTNTSIQTH